MHAAGQTQLSGAFPLLERFPWLRYMPSWFPGCSFKKLANECRKTTEEIYTTLYNMVLDNLVSSSFTNICGT
jgi:hypothetical protein